VCDRASRVGVAHPVNGAIRWHGRKVGKGGGRKDRSTEKRIRGTRRVMVEMGGDLGCRGEMVGIEEPK
jgi:hypothetical protein